MLQSIHDKAKGILGIIIVIFIGLVFALWGIGDYLTGAKEKYAARVGDVEISQSEYEQGLARQRQRLEQVFQGAVPDTPVFQQRIKDQVLEQLITQRVLQKVIEEEGYRVSDQVLAQRIKDMESFQIDGVFAKDAYQATIQSQGMAIKEFENLFRNDLALQQFQNAVMASSIIGHAELKILSQIKNQSRDISYLLFEDDQFMSEISVSDEEIKEYFEMNQSRYMHPESVSVSYIELKGADLAKDIPVDDEAVRRLYDEYVSSLAGKEQRKARHILISLAADADAETQKEVKAKVDGLLERINKGESFITLAKENSDDPGSAANGGDLSWVTKGMMVPEFESALFKLNKGEVSSAVKSSFGYHIIRLDDIKAEPVDSFESRQAELTDQYKAQLLEDRFYEKSELMATTAYENDHSLQEVADAIGATIKSTNTFTRNTGNGIASNDKVRQAAFDSAVLNEGRNSEIIELEKNHALVLRVDAHTKAKPKVLDDVKAQITAMLKTEKAKQKAQESALTALVKLEQGKAISNKDVFAAGDLKKVGSVKRDNTAVNQQVLREAFTMPKPVNNKPVYRVVELAAGSAVIELKSVTTSSDVSPEQMQALTQQIQNEQSNRDMNAVLNYLKSQTTIVRTKEL